jgi:NADPH:quinone reductase-like Zn-dependent oxidoreductase
MSSSGRVVVVQDLESPNRFGWYQQLAQLAGAKGFGVAAFRGSLDLSVPGPLVGSREMFEAMNQALGAREIRPLIDTVFPFADTPAAYRHLESQRHMGKVVIVADD